jgi:hypothetical protein
VSRSVQAGVERVIEQGKLSQENQIRRPVEAA